MVDTKNWTWVLQRQCPECGFDAGGLARADIAPATRAVAQRFAALLAVGDGVRDRPSPEVWSALEYGCHVRDVFTVMQGRLQVMVDEEAPTFANWDQDVTAVEDDYARQDPAEVSRDLVANGLRLADAYASVGDGQWERPGFRSDGSSFTVESLGRYMVHDPVHHVWDVEQGFAVLNRTRA